MELLQPIPASLVDFSSKSLQWGDLLAHLARAAQSPLGKARLLSLVPSADAAWIDMQQQRHAEMQRLVAGGSFDFRGIFDVSDLLDKARVEGSALEALELRSLIVHAERVEAWRQTVLAATLDIPAIAALSAPLLQHDLGHLLRALSGKIEPDGGLADDASPQLARIRRALAAQHRAIEASLRRALAKLSDDGSTQDALITVRGERFVIPVKAEFKRKVGGVVHGSSSSGQTVFVEPLETIEYNNELTRLLDEEQAEIHRILVGMTRAVAGQAQALLVGASILAAADAHQAVAQFAAEFDCVRPGFAVMSVADARSSTAVISTEAQRSGEIPAFGDATEVGRHPAMQGSLHSVRKSADSGRDDGSGEAQARAFSRVDGGGQAQALLVGASILAAADAHQAVAQFATEFDCVRPRFAVMSVADARSSTAVISTEAQRSGEIPAFGDATEVGRHPAMQGSLHSVRKSADSGRDDGDGEAQARAFSRDDGSGEAQARAFSRVDGGGQAQALLVGASILAAADAHQAVAQFAAEFDCVRPGFAVMSVADARSSTAVISTEAQRSGEIPAFGDATEVGRHPAMQGSLHSVRKSADSGRDDGSSGLSLVAARHPLLELRLRAREAEEGAAQSTIVPLTIALPAGKRQLIVSGPNTGGKTVALKTTGLLAAMAQAGLPVPASSARLPRFDAIYADIGDAQSIEQNLSTFSAHIVNVDRIARLADDRSLVLLDELGSATDPEEGAALAVAVAEHFLHKQAWCLITTHLTSLKVYAAKHEGVLNAAVGFDEATLTPTYDLRLGVPGASAGLNIAARLGLDPAIVANARAQRTTQQIDIGRFLDELHAQLSAATAERERLAAAEKKVAYERMLLEVEGRKEQQARTKALEGQLKSLIEDFEAQLRDTVKAIDDKTVAQKIARDSALRIAQLKREFSAQFQSTVEEHTATPNQQAAKTAQRDREPRVGDLVRLKSLNREGRVLRLVDAKTLEVQVGPMKTRVPRSDIAEVVAAAPTEKQAARLATRRGGVNIAGTGGDSDYITSEINVIGRTAEEAEGEVDRFVERAFLAGLPRIRVVHGVGMGILRRTLRDFLKNHPHVTSVTEPPYNEGGQGATLVELRQ